MSLTERRETLIKQYRDLQQQLAVTQAALLRTEGAIAMLDELSNDAEAAPVVESANGNGIES